MVNWVQIAGVIYAETSALSARDFIAVERTTGAGTLRILGVHFNSTSGANGAGLSPLGISTTVLLEATLSFLGVGYSRQRRVGATSSLKARAILLRLRAGVLSRRGDCAAVALFQYRW